MNLHRLAVTASVLTTALWTAKAVAIGLAGGLGRSPAEGPLFFLGLLAFVAATVLTGMALAPRHTSLGRLLAAVVAVLVAVVYGALEGALISAVQPSHPGWVWGELNLWVLMLTVLAVATGHAVASNRALRRRSGGPTFRSDHLASKMQA